MFERVGGDIVEPAIAIELEALVAHPLFELVRILVPSGTRVVRPYAPAACVASASDLDVSDARVLVPCGLVPGASGGGLYVERNGEQVLVGILSTVTADLSTNGVVPLASLHELLQHPEQYTQGFSSGHVHHEHVRSELS